MGATDSEEIDRAIREANARADVKAIMLNIDPPGGTGAGAPELANAVASPNEHKPVLHQGSTRALACRMGRPRRIHGGAVIAERFGQVREIWPADWDALETCGGFAGRSTPINVSGGA
jgi:hypothetical protein